MNKTEKKKQSGSLGIPVALGHFPLVRPNGLFCDPFRETAVDDDWAYALTVKHLLDTGHYH